MSDDNHALVMRVLSCSLRRILEREALIGRSSRISGAARLKPSELHDRLVLLRDRISVCCEQSLNVAQSEPQAFSLKPLRRSFKNASKAIDRPSFKGMHTKTLYNKLTMIVEALQAARHIMLQGAITLGNEIDPDARLDISTPKEVAELYGEEPKGCALVLCLRADAELEHCLSETWAILKGRFGWSPNPKGGRYTRLRGAKIAARLIGMGVGLGLKPTRNPISQSFSACDAVLSARSSLAKFTDVTVLEILIEIPTGYDGMEHIWVDAQKGDDLGSHMRTGIMLGKSMLQKRSKSAS